MDAKAGWIVSDNDWKYKVESNGSGMRPKLRRYNDKGQEEFVIVDNRNGVFQQKDIKEGARVTEVFRTPGPLYGKLRKVENILPDGTRKLVYQASYDERGRKIRTVDEQGTSMVFKYSPDGKLLATRTSLSTDFLAELKKKETQLLAELEKENNQERRGGMLHDLWIFYVVEMKDMKKAATFLNVIKGGESRFSLKLSLIISNPDMVFERRNTQLAQLIQEYPDKMEYIEDLMIKD
jgi:YD repeat-containing protein